MVTDGELVDRCLAGDGGAFGEIVFRHKDAVFRHLLRLARSREQAEDLCQETFLRLYRALRKFDRARPLPPYLLKIAANHAVGARAGFSTPLLCPVPDSSLCRVTYRRAPESGPQSTPRNRRNRPLPT